MRILKATGGEKILIDNDDYKWAKYFSWTVTWGSVNKNVASVRTYETGFRLCRVIMEVVNGQIVDHVNGNGLDNQKNNLRICTRRENLFNKKKYLSGKNRFKGVYKRKLIYKNTWEARINFNKKPIYLGDFSNEIDAAKAYNERAKKLYGQFAKLNIVC